MRLALRTGAIHHQKKRLGQALAVLPQACRGQANRLFGAQSSEGEGMPMVWLKPPST